MNEQEKLLKHQNKYHIAPSLLEIVPVTIASYYNVEHARQDFEMKSNGKFPGIHTASPTGVNKSHGGSNGWWSLVEAQFGLQVECVVNNAFTTFENTPAAFELRLAR